MKNKETLEKIIESFDKRFVSGMFRTEKQQEMVDFLSSTYDTAYEKGVRDAMDTIGEDEKNAGVSEYYSGINAEKSRLRLALSELLKK